MKIVLITDPKVLAIPIQENHDPLIDLRDQKIITFGPSPEISDNIDYTKIRRNVYERILEAQKMLTQFKRKFAREMESGKKERVYTLSMQFFPLSKNNGGKNNENNT